MTYVSLALRWIPKPLIGQGLSVVFASIGMTDQPLTTVRDLSVHCAIGGGFFGHKNYVKAVNKVSIEIAPGTFFGLVGVSGSAKTTLGRALL